MPQAQAEFSAFGAKNTVSFSTGSSAVAMRRDIFHQGPALKRGPILRLPLGDKISRTAADVSGDQRRQRAPLRPARYLAFLNYRLGVFPFSENHPDTGEHQACTKKRPHRKCLAAKCPT